MEEIINRNILLNLVAEGCELNERVKWTFSDYVVSLSNRMIRTEQQISERVVRKESSQQFALVNELLIGQEKKLIYYTDTISRSSWNSSNPVILSGSFNPAHSAHFEMASRSDMAFAGQYNPTFFELSVCNVDKPALDYITIEERLKTVEDRHVWLTNVPTFVEKAKIFPNTIFVIGMDTAKRICDPKYAGNMDDVIKVFDEQGSTFLVFERYNDGHEIRKTSSQIRSEIPDKRFAAMCIIYDTPLQHTNVSSTEIRNRQAHTETAGGVNYE
jgi:nicotinic acid mononucleotide adenylyltransferase